MPRQILITCEHGGNRVPTAYRPYFQGKFDLLHSHEGYDRGALRMARQLANELHAPLVAGTVTRLLVDLNRSLGHSGLHADVIARLPLEERKRIIATCYQPYRHRGETIVSRAIHKGKTVIHLSSHSFTPVLDGKVRQADLGILYDPTRPGERALCQAWAAALRDAAPELKVRRNYPYRGNSDGFTAYLREHFPPNRYIGIEIEINQRWVSRAPEWAALREILVGTLQRTLGAVPENQLARAAG